MNLQQKIEELREYIPLSNWEAKQVELLQPDSYDTVREIVGDRTDLIGPAIVGAVREWVEDHPVVRPDSLEVGDRVWVHDGSWTMRVVSSLTPFSLDGDRIDPLAVTLYTA